MNCFSASHAAKVDAALTRSAQENVVSSRRRKRHEDGDGSDEDKENIDPLYMGDFPILSSAASSRFLAGQERRGTHGRIDRTQWGSYLEHAPPVLPPGASPSSVFSTEVASTTSVASEDEEDEDANSDEKSSRRVTRDISQSSSGARRRRAPTESHGLLDFSRFSSLPLPSSLTFPSTATGPSASPLSSKTTSKSTLTKKSLIKTRRMAPKAHTWITLWFLLTAPVITWDVLYVFMRPRSMVGGDLHWIWKPYAKYQEVDYIYGLPALESGDGFPNAQSALNVVETLLNLYYVFLVHVSGSDIAPLVGFASATMTLWKTVLYWVQEYYCGGCAVGHNNLFDLFFLWIVPNGLWLIFPSLVMYRLGSDMASALRLASSGTSGKKKQ